MGEGLGEVVGNCWVGGGGSGLHDEVDDGVVRLPETDGVLCVDGEACHFESGGNSIVGRA